MKFPVSRPSDGPDIPARHASLGITLRVAAELSALIALCAFLIAAVDGFGG